MDSQDGIDDAGPLCQTGANGVRDASAAIKSLNKTGQKVPIGDFEAGDSESSVTPGVIGPMNSQDGIDVAGQQCQAGSTGATRLLGANARTRFTGPRRSSGSQGLAAPGVGVATGFKGNDGMPGTGRLQEPPYQPGAPALAGWKGQHGPHREKGKVYYIMIVTFISDG